MSSAAAVLVCVLEVLGRSSASLPPITLIDVVPRGVSANAEAFVRDGTIYLVTTSAVFRDAVRAEVPGRHNEPFKKLASILVHEEWHVLHGADERAAYEAQLTALTRLGASSTTHHSVTKSMLAVAARERKLRQPPAPDQVLAQRTFLSGAP